MTNKISSISLSSSGLVRVVRRNTDLKAVYYRRVTVSSALRLRRFAQRLQRARRRFVRVGDIPCPSYWATLRGGISIYRHSWAD